MKAWKDDAIVVATRCGPCGKPRRGFPSAARAERHVHADSRDAVDHVVGITSSPSKSAMRTWCRTLGTGRPNRPHARISCSRRSVARRGSAHRTAALVDRVGEQRFAELESLAHIGQIGGGGLTTESITALLASARAIPSACRGPWSAAHQAATRTITPSLTPGHVAGRRYGQVFVRRQSGPVNNKLRVALDGARRNTDC